MSNRETSVPIEFSALQGKVHYVTRRGTAEYSGSCPNCGGAPHSDGSFPDRFRMLQRSRATGGALGWCRSCGFTWWPGKDEGREWKPNADQQAAWIEEREQSEQQRAEAIGVALELLQKERIWAQYHDGLTEEIREMYRTRGIPDFWIDYLQLGYNPNKWYQSAGMNHIGAALTIPVFEPESWRVLNIKNRLISPVDPDDKYRPEVKGLPAALYSTEPEKKLKGRCLLVEGEFKAIVTYIALDDYTTVVEGLPSKTPDTELLKKLDDCEPIIYCLDPDAYRVPPGHHRSAADRLGAALGKRGRAMRLNDKLDDLINAGHIDTAALRRLLDGARAN